MATSALTPVAVAQTLQSYTLENVKSRNIEKKADVLIPRIEITGTNVSRADMERLVAPDLSQEARADIVMNMKAQRIFIPEVVISRNDEEKGRFVLRNYLVTNLDNARFDRISLGSIEGTMTTKEAAEGTFKSGQITLEGGDFSKVAAAAKAGDPSDGVAKLRLFSWSGFEMTITEPKVLASAPGGNSYRFGLKSATAKTDYSGDLPTKAIGSFDGMYFVAPPSSDVGKALADFGYNRVEFGVKFDGTYNPAARTFALDDYSFTGLNAGSLALSGAFTNLDPSTFTNDTSNRLASLMKGRIAGLNLRYVDAGLFDKALVFFAKSQGKDPAAVRKEWSMMIVGMLPMLMGGDPVALKLSEALSAFVTQPKSLAISLKGKSGPINIADFAKLMDPSFLLSQVEITAVANR
ncbi:MAG: hypothetical protein Q8M31_18300 [Beijerinckiaceae bacterium]|nr:hypothetical protein [Beijerinckiaceae bacterium]